MNLRQAKKKLTMSGCHIPPKGTIITVIKPNGEMYRTHHRIKTLYKIYTSEKGDYAFWHNRIKDQCGYFFWPNMIKGIGFPRKDDSILRWMILRCDNNENKSNIPIRFIDVDQNYVSEITYLDTWPTKDTIDSVIEELYKSEIDIQKEADNEL